ncbi:DNA helicase Pif1-like [Cinara cedri]|uniref:ATP-dependent DNA helicase n=1 Tax=Cinara cedri TaxID=506608 RepID=A0A5E4NRT9_9HEMI|nr:DNA helicase Pif1-like [Cinara cedri]
MLMDGGLAVLELPFGTLNSMSTITMQSARAQRIRDAALIVWDEAPIPPGMQLSVVDRLLKNVMQSDLPFEGKSILFTGNYRQILPVFRRGTRSDIIRSSIKYNRMWRHMERFSLTRNVRTDNDEHFSAWLLKLGNSKLTQDRRCFGRRCDSSGNSLNDDCKEVNCVVLDARVVGNAKMYTAIDTTVVGDLNEVDNYPKYIVSQHAGTGRTPTVQIGAESRRRRHVTDCGTSIL